MTPLISVIMPSYNRAHIIGDAIRSVIAQQFQDWELVIVDDGSTDDTKRSVPDAFPDARIVFLAREHAGVSAARNHGVAASKGEIVTYLDSDNIWRDDYLRFVASVYDERPEVTCAYAAIEIENPEPEGNEVLWKPFNRGHLRRGNYIDINVFSHRRRLFGELGGFDENLKRLVDWDLILRYTEKNAPYEIAVIGALYRKGEADRITLVENYEANRAAVCAKWGM
jgi:glycosyltransferase involved in cell wall biosynthesis